MEAAKVKGEDGEDRRVLAHSKSNFGCFFGEWCGGFRQVSDAVVSAEIAGCHGAWLALGCHDIGRTDADETTADELEKKGPDLTV